MTKYLFLPTKKNRFLLEDIIQAAKIENLDIQKRNKGYIVPDKVVKCVADMRHDTFAHIAKYFSKLSNKDRSHKEKPTAEERKSKKKPWAVRIREYLFENRTQSERKLFDLLPKTIREETLRQHKVAVNGHLYFLDMYIPSIHLAIEVDGSSHDKRKEQDKERDNNVKRLGITTYRITNEQCNNADSIHKLLSFILNRKRRMKR